MRTDQRNAAYEAIDGERAYQAAKWNEKTTPSGGRHSPVEWLVYMRDYVEEALHFATRNADPAANHFAMENIRKVAALAVAAMEEHGAVKRDWRDKHQHATVADWKKAERGDNFDE